MIIILNEKGFLGVFTQFMLAAGWLRFVQMPHSILIFSEFEKCVCKILFLFLGYHFLY